jgi:TRAP-type C4-dicarboxylate transport system permease small subunit
MGDREAGSARDLPRADGGLMGRACYALCAIALVVTIIVVGQEVVSRAVWNTSLEISNDLAGYMLVAIAFISLPIVHSTGSLHRTSYLQAFLSDRGKAISDLIFDVVTLLVVLILLWQFTRYWLGEWRGGYYAPTRLETPLWIPAVPMVLGTAAFCLSLLAAIARHVKRLAARPEWQPDRKP